MRTFWPCYRALTGWFCFAIATGGALPSRTAEAQLTAGLKAARAHTVMLDDQTLDLVTAGSGQAALALSASAGGPTANATTEGSILTAQRNVLRVSIDRTAPGPASAKLLGQFDAEFILSKGKAQATGSNSAQCSAATTITGNLDYLALGQSETRTMVSATCLCSGFAIGPVGQ